MTETVYLLGAGVNQAITNSQGLSPPLIDNFFRVALNIDIFKSPEYSERLTRVYTYIERFWKLSVNDLKSGPFNIEECFTLIALQLRKAISERDNEKIEELRWVQYLLKSFLAEVLMTFAYAGHRSNDMMTLGKIIFTERATVLTFNYDTLIEESIQSASGVSPDGYPEALRNYIREQPTNDKVLPDEALGARHFKWVYPLGYGVKFDELPLPVAGVPIQIDGDRYYNAPTNKLHEPPFLKLHGSVNWFRYTPVRALPTIPGETPPQFTKELQKKVILNSGNWWFTTPPSKNGWFLDAIIVTPDLHKERNLAHSIFDTIWSAAQEALSECSKLVVIGYSFPPTDFMTRKLFLESFSNHQLDELVVVNPDTSIVKTVKTLCHYDRPVVVCRDLDEFVKSHALVDILR